MTTFAAAAVRVSVLNAVSNILLLLGNAYAARCLGPANVGISAQVVISVQQLSLAFNGGLDTTSVRQVAGGDESAAAVGRAVLTYRLAVALPVAVCWIAWVFMTHEPGFVRTAWLLGAPLLVLASVQPAFLFQATDRMPSLAAFTLISSALVAACYAVFFRPGMPAGSDLWVLTIVGVVVAAATIATGLRLAGLRAGDLATGWRDSATLALRLLAQSWRYWLLALLVFVYTGFPVLLVARLQGDAAAGILRVCLQLAAGLEVFFASINAVLLPRLVRWQREGDETLWSHQWKQLAWHVALGGAALLLTAAAAPFVFRTLFGSQFNEGIAPFLVLATSRVVVFVGQIFVWGVIALRLDGVLLGATICGAAVSLVLNLVLIPHYSLLGASIAALAAELVIGSLCFVFQRRNLERTRIAHAAARDA